MVVFEKGRNLLPGLGSKHGVGSLFGNEEIKAGRVFENQDEILEPRTGRTQDDAAQGVDRSFVGDINDLRIDSNGNIVSVIVGVGGFLGLGAKDVALPFNEFSFGRDGAGNVVVTAKVTKERLQSAPEWKKPEDR